MYFCLPAKILLCLVLLSAAAFAQQQEEKQLAEIQQQINEKQKRVEQQLAVARKLQQELKENELAIASAARKLNQTQIALANNQQQQLQLKQRQGQIVADQSIQRELLAKQLRSAFMAGNHDYVKMLLNQEDAGKFERVNTYYQYLNNARKTQIDSLKKLATELQQVNGALIDKQAALTNLESEQQQQRSELTQQQTARENTLVRIEQNIDSEAAKIEQLQINEQSLRKAIEAAQIAVRQAAERRQAESVSLSGLANLKGRLFRPADGRLRNLYGARRQGQVRWKGIMISGSSGSPVGAVHQGTVLYADWLKGFGLVIVVDHGEGYMSLYGHNQALLKQAGDAVDAGETIALVGQSGGQSAPGLYFEIRHKGKAINPKGWFARG